MSAVLPRRPLAGRSDAALVELISDGDEAAFETLVRRYWRELLIYSDRLLGAEGRAEDACQQALLQAWLAQKEHSEQQDHKHEPDGGSLHRGRSEEGKAISDKWQLL